MTLEAPTTPAILQPVEKEEEKGKEGRRRRRRRKKKEELVAEEGRESGRGTSNTDSYHSAGWGSLSDEFP